MLFSRQFRAKIFVAMVKKKKKTRETYSRMTAHATLNIIMCMKFLTMGLEGLRVLEGTKRKQALGLPECSYKSYPQLCAPGYFKGTVYQDEIFDSSGQWIGRKL